jgi:hypothetical protein
MNQVIALNRGLAISWGCRGKLTLTTGEIKTSESKPKKIEMADPTYDIGV